MVKTNDKGGSADLRIQMLELTISIPFHRSYAGGLTQFVDDYETAFVERSLILGVATWDKDSNKKRRLLHNVASSNMSWLPHLAKSLYFEGVCLLLREHALKVEHRAKENAIKKAFLTKLGETTLETEAYLSHITPEIWHKLPTDVKDLIGKLKREEYVKNGPPTDARCPTES